MSEHQPPPEDVLYLSSSDDQSAPSRKRSFHDSEDSSDMEKGSRRSKRLRNASKATVSTPDGSTGVEEGEIKDEPTQRRASASSSKDPSSGPPSQTEAKSLADETSIFFPSPPPVYKLNLGVGHLDLKLPVFSAKREGNWDDRFAEWAQKFCDGNAAYSGNINSSTIQAAYSQYLDQHTKIKGKKKKSAKQAAQTFMEKGGLQVIIKSMPPAKKVHPKPDTSTKDRQSEEEYEPTIEDHEMKAPEAGHAANALEQNGEQAVSNGANQDGNSLSSATVGKSTGPTVITDETTMKQLRTYFPSAADPSNMCLRCGSQTHPTSNCSYISCKFCNSNDHWSFVCSTRDRCGKCRQLGHGSQDCKEKLAMTKSDGLACSFCDSPDHLEDDCTLMWRTFVPNVDTISAVTFIAPSCSWCGSSSHYFSDCASRKGPCANKTWSLPNRDMYMDPKSSSLAIEGQAAASDSQQKSKVPQMSIRGHASRTNNVVHYSSDDSDVEFLGAKPSAKRAPLGQIRMASNIQMPSNAAVSSQGGRMDQPPLPPGPPPPGPPQRQGPSGRHPSGPHASLPAKPPTARDNRNPPPQAAAGSSWNNGDRGPPRFSGSGSRGGQRGGRGGRGGGGSSGARGRGGRGRGRGRN